MKTISELFQGQSGNTGGSGTRQTDPFKPITYAYSGQQSQVSNNTIKPHYISI